MASRKPTAAELATLDATPMPAWVDRSKIKMVTAKGIDGKDETAPTLIQEFPAHLRRSKLLSTLTPPTFEPNMRTVSRKEFRRVKQICGETWMRRRIDAKDVGATVEIRGGGGERLFFTVLKPGWLRARYHRMPDGRLVLVIDDSQGACVLKADMELYRAHVEEVAK